MELLTPGESGRLVPPEPLSLIAQLWDSLEQDQLPVIREQAAELDHRLASLDDDRKSGVTWTALKAEHRSAVRRHVFSHLHPVRSPRIDR